MKVVQSGGIIIVEFEGVSHHYDRDTARELATKLVALFPLSEVVPVSRLREVKA